MNNIPALGGMRGIFAIFVPGVFLFLNLIAVLYLLPIVENDTKKLIVDCISNPTRSLLISITFGYLIGVVLRLFRCGLPDKWSSILIRWRGGRLKDPVETKPYDKWAYEEFPYFGWIEVVCKKYYPPEAKEFYDQTWDKRRKNYYTTNYFNFVKSIINAKDERSANEIYSAEALTRYMSSMFYALLISSGLIFLTLIINYFYTWKMRVGLVIILIIYLISLISIVRHFRFIRIKEVEAVFAACLINKSLFIEEPSSTKPSKTGES